jgi:hypothetical protein
MTLLLEGENAGCLSSFGSFSRHDDDDDNDSIDITEESSIFNRLRFTRLLPLDVSW